jgi:hypothetical protein
MKESGSKDLAKKDSGTKDVGPKKIDFGTGEAKATPAPSSVSCKREDSAKCYPEYESFNRGADPDAHALNISAKHNGGTGSLPSPQDGM